MFLPSDRSRRESTIRLVGIMSQKRIPALCCVAILLAAWSCGAPLQLEPGGTEADEYLALNNPDEYAWRLFFFINRQAEPGSAGLPDPTKRFGELDPQAAVVWETWALASGDDQSEVFPPNGTEPVEWEKLDRSERKRHLILSPNLELQMMMEEQKSDLKSKKKPRHTGIRIKKPSTGIIAFPPMASRVEEQEVRMNHAAFNSIRKQGLFSAEGLESSLEIARQTNNASLIAEGVRPESKEVKAEWIQIEDSENSKSRYLWRELSGKIYGLVALHIATKDLPTWFWADFGHVDCEDGKNPCPYQKDSRNDPEDSTTRGLRATHGAKGIRKETEGTVWSNYILRGTETSFTKARGELNRLSSPVIESSFQNSSCITCHANATVGTRRVGASDVNHLPPNFQLGTPNVADFIDPKEINQIKYLQTDFMWSPVINAKRTK
jgi:hypothetical protein